MPVLAAVVVLLFPLYFFYPSNICFLRFASPWLTDTLIDTRQSQRLYSSLHCSAIQVPSCSRIKPLTFSFSHLDYTNVFCSTQNNLLTPFLFSFLFVRLSFLLATKLSVALNKHTPKSDLLLPCFFHLIFFSPVFTIKLHCRYFH